ncbi:hypothetical protein A9Z05_31450 [Burkholderia sp. A2]|nr:hypothetical protein A9Z05_31450 [Burkholderia sp. A2]
MPTQRQSARKPSIAAWTHANPVGPLTARILDEPADEIVAEHARQERAHRRGVREHAYVAFYARRLFLPVAGQLLELAQHAARMRVARRGQRDALAREARQFHADLLLEGLDAHDRGRPRQMRAFGGARGDARFGDLREKFEVDENEAHGRGGGRMADWRVKPHGAAPPAATRRRGRDLCTIVHMARRAAPGITARATRVGEAVLQRR